MTAEATQSPPTKTKAMTAAARKIKAAKELELIRWTPEEVVELRLLPYTSVRVLRDKCHKREIHCHTDGGRITFTADDIRQENERTAVPPIDSRTKRAA